MNNQPTVDPARILALYESGMSMRRVAHLVGLSTTRVQQVIAKRGRPRDRHGREK